MACAMRETWRYVDVEMSIDRINVIACVAAVLIALWFA